MNKKSLAFHPVLDRFEGLAEQPVAEKSDVITALAVVLTLEVRVIFLVRLEDDVASGDEEEPLGIPALGNEEASGALSPRHRLGTDGETQRGDNRFADIYGGYPRAYFHRAVTVQSEV